MRSNGGTRSATALPSRPDLVLPYGISLRRTEKAPRGVRTSRVESSVSPVSETITPLAEKGRLTGVMGVNWRRGPPGVAAIETPRLNRGDRRSLCDDTARPVRLCLIANAQQHAYGNGSVGQLRSG